VAAAVQRDRAPLGQRLARLAHDPVEVSPRERDRHADVLEAREDRHAHRGVRGLVAGRGQVRAHQPRGRLGGHALGVGHRPAQHQLPPVRGAQQGWQHRQQPPPERARVATRPGPERSRPQPRGAEPGDRQRAPRLGQLQRDPAAQRVAGHVGTRHAEVVEQGGHGRREHLRGGSVAVAQPGGVAEAGQVDRDHVAVPRQALHHRLPDHQLRPERMNQDERLAAAPAHVVERARLQVSVRTRVRLANEPEPR